MVLFMGMFVALWTPLQARNTGGISATPGGVEDLKAIQSMLQQVLPSAMKPLVWLESSAGGGTGIIVSSDGMIYTAAHVVMAGAERKNDVLAVFADGSRHKVEIVKTDSMNDAGILKVVGKVDCPFHINLAPAQPVVGEWVFSLGHGNGFDKNRGAAVRLGRVVSIRNGFYKTDCKLIGGDSGGPLLNMKGELIGIHSRVGDDLEHNIHIPNNIFDKIKGGGTSKP